jgi:hypothetical protein
MGKRNISLIKYNRAIIYSTCYIQLQQFSSLLPVLGRGRGGGSVLL